MKVFPLRLHLPPLDRRAPLLMMGAMLIAAVAAQLLQPTLANGTTVPDLEATVPQQFGEWRAVTSPYVPANLTVAEDGQPSTDQPYDQSLLRTYRNDKGDIVMLALAYGKNQRQEVKIHRPELCYPAQGYLVQEIEPVTFIGLPGEHRPVTGKRLLTASPQRLEAVTYWIRIGGVYSDSAWTTRLHIIREGLAGRIPDGILVRASRLVDSADQASLAYPQLETFLRELVAATPPNTRRLLLR